MYSTDERIPTGRRLPVQLAKELPDNSAVWLEEQIDAKKYETYYIRQPRSASNDVIALGMETLNTRWHLFSITRLVAFFFTCSLIGVGAVFGIQRLRGKTLTIDFRTKLLAAFIVVSLIPLSILAYYNRRDATDRSGEMMTKRLSRESGIIVNELQLDFRINTPFDLDQLTNGQCEDLANSLSTDFNVYTNGALLASSKPEIFFAELLSPT